MNDKRKPEIRFDGFDEEWEQKRLKDIAEFNPKSIVPEIFEYVDLESVVGTDLISHRNESRKTAPSRAQRLAKKGDVFFQTVRPYQKNNYLFDLSDNEYVFSTGYAQIRPQVDGYFLFTTLQEEKLVLNVLNKCTGTSYPAINSKDLMEINIQIPSKRKEQAKIGSIFKKLDNVITFHQHELDNLKQMKQGFLQKMFPKEGKLVPELRFPGYIDNWKQSKLEIFIEDYIEKTTVQNQYPVLTSSQKYGIVYQEDYFADRQVTTQNNIGYFVLPRGYFTYRSRSDNGVFKFNRNDLVDNGIISYFYPVFRIVNGDSEFFLELLNSTIKKQVSLKSEGTGQRVLSLKNFKNIIVTTPCIQEQIKIGIFFKQLNNLILFQELELDLLKQTKEAFLQKIFI